MQELPYQEMDLIIAILKDRAEKDPDDPIMQDAHDSLYQVRSKLLDINIKNRKPYDSQSDDWWPLIDEER